MRIYRSNEYILFENRLISKRFFCVLISFGLNTNKKKIMPRQFPLTNDLNGKIKNQPKRMEDLIPDLKCIVSSSYERDREFTIICYVNKVQVMFCLYFGNSRSTPKMNVTHARNFLYNYGQY